MNNNRKGVEETRTEVLVELVREGLKPKADSAQVRQTVTRTYPAVQGGNSLSTGLFSSKSFGKGEEYSHERVAFADIPKGFTVEQAQERLNNFPTACIYKIFSYDVLDVMNENQIEAMETGFSNKTIEFYQEKYAVLDKQKEVVMEGDNVLYSSSHFMNEFKEDVNLRSTEAVATDRVSIATEVVASEETTVPAHQM